MYNYSEEEAIIKNVRQVAQDFLYQISKAFNKDKKYYNEYYWDIESVGYGTRTYVSAMTNWNNKLSVFLDVNDILTYSNKNGVDLESATKIILSHEIFHILLGHFSSKYKNHDKKILNIAGDLEINQLIGLKYPGIQPEDLSMKPFRNTDYYYGELIKEIESKKKDIEDIVSQIKIDGAEGDASDSDKKENEDSETQPDDIEEKVSSEESTGYEEGTEEMPSSSKNAPETGRGTQSIEEEILEDMLPDDVMINEATIEIMGSETIEIDETPNDLRRVEEVVKKNLSKKDTYSIKGLDEIVRKIINKEKAVKITPHDKVNTYYKFNNRRKSDFILPGKRLTNSGTKKKLDSSLTVFIDVSGSTRGKVNIDLMNVARKMHSIGASIVYYRDSIVSVCEPNRAFFTEYGVGGTRITDTVAQYIREGYDLHRAYVFTDGQDNFFYLKEACEKFNVYFVSNGKVYEKYNEKSHIPNTRWW